MPSCQRTSGRLTSRCSNARLGAVTPRWTTSRRYAAKRTRRPRPTAPTFDWRDVDARVRRHSDVCHTDTQCKVLGAEPWDLQTVSGTSDSQVWLLWYCSSCTVPHKRCSLYLNWKEKKKPLGLQHIIGASLFIFCFFFTIKACSVSNSTKGTSLKSKTHLDYAHYQHINLLLWHLKC